MIADIMAEYGGRLLVAIGGVGLGLICLIAALKFYRQRFGGSSPFVRGGRSRDPRLQVVDATAVDTRRRLVLVRRDDVEHLIMIGGPTDIVIESNISANPAPSALSPAPQPPLESYTPAELPRPARLPDPARPAMAEALRPLPPQTEPSLSRHAVSAPRQVRVHQDAPVEKPLERPLPVTPQAAYFEASDDFTPPPVQPPRATAESTATPQPTPSEAAALKEAEQQIEAMKRRQQASEKPTAAPRPRSASEGPSDFSQVLSEEMKAPLRETPRPVPPAVQQMPRREAPAPADDPNLQDEIARIFGEKR